MVFTISAMVFTISAMVIRLSSVVFTFLSLGFKRDMVTVYHRNSVLGNTVMDICVL